MGSIKARHHVLCTVGNSALGNLRKNCPGREEEEMIRWLAALDPEARDAGAEVNSLALMAKQGAIHPDSCVHLLHSATEEGRLMGRVLHRVTRHLGFSPGSVREIGGLNEDPADFRKNGLRNLAVVTCDLLRQFGTEQCAINATGGFKAQVAIAVVVGQVLGLPVYYKHELFNHVISLPPLPVAPSLEVWRKLSAVFTLLRKSNDCRPMAEVMEILRDQGCQWEPEFDGLLEVEEIDGQEEVTISPLGWVFNWHILRRYKDLVRVELAAVNPGDKYGLRTGKSEPKAQGLLKKCQLGWACVREVPFVRGMTTNYFNPDCSARNLFCLKNGNVTLVWCNGTEAIRFEVDTSAQTEEEKRVAVEHLNRWLEERE